MTEDKNDSLLTEEAKQKIEEAKQNNEDEIQTNRDVQAVQIDMRSGETHEYGEHPAETVAGYEYHRNRPLLTIEYYVDDEPHHATFILQRIEKVDAQLGPLYYENDENDKVYVEPKDEAQTTLSEIQSED